MAHGEIIKNQIESMHALMKLFELQFLYRAEKTIHGTETLTNKAMEIREMIDESNARTNNTQLMQYYYSMLP